jgi:hypothetical protein
MSIARAAVVVVALAGGISPAWAATVYNVQVDTSIYGRENQNNVGAPPGGGGANSCVPTSVANGFQYLQTRFPAYNNALVPGTLVETGSNLAYNYLSTSSDTGTTGTNWIDGKRDYLEQVAPGVTTYAGQVSQGFYGGTLAGVQKGTDPTWQFLFDQLVRGAAIEIGIIPAAGGIGHALSLTSFHWTDANDDGIIQQAEGGQIDVIDPAAPDNVTWISVWQAANGAPLQLDYSNQAYTTVLAIAQLPTPGVTVLVAMGLVAAGRRRR